jgi:ankyrin repeat protein
MSGDHTETDKPFSHTSQEQVRLLRQATTRRIMRRVRDDTETLISARSQAASSAASISQRSSFTASDRIDDFNKALADSPVYRKSPQQLAPSIGASGSQTDTNSGRSPFTDEGYADTLTRNSSVQKPSFDAAPFQQHHTLLPTSPSAPVPPAHTRATSYQDGPRLGLQNMPRSKSDTKTPKTLERSASKLERISSLFRLNTTSRLNLASSSSKGSPKVGNDTPFTRVKPRREPNPHISIDLTGADAASIPQIVKAAQAGSRGEVARLIEYGINIEDRHKASGRNALLVAAHCGNNEVVELLIRYYARLDVTDGSGWTALHLAASRGHCGVISLVMEESNIAEVPNYQGRTALRIAVDRGQPEALQMLLKHNAKVNTRAENQMTALHTAAKQGYAEIVYILVSNGADIEAKDATMMSALHYACEAGHVEAIAVLLAHKANIEAAGRDRKTPLICAAEAGRSQAVELLLKSKQKASSSGIDDTGMTALHWAAYNGHEETVEILSQKKGSLAKVNAMGRTALHLSVIQTQFAVVEPLIRKGADLNSQCAAGLTPLHYACMADSIEIATLLLLGGADIEASEYQQQQRPLHIAAARSSVRLLDLLCEKGASLNARDSVGDRPLSVACRCGHVAAVRQLLDRGSPLYQKHQATSHSDSPLCFAAMAGHLPVVSLLLERGASASKKDEGGWQPFRYAAYHGHVDVLQALLIRTSIPNMDVPDIIRMPETIGFSPDAIISEDCKARVGELLNQTLANSGLIPPSHIPNMPQTGNRGHYPAQYIEPRNLRDHKSFLPQELPATLEHGLPSSRSTTPERGYRAEPPKSIDPLWHDRIRPGEQPSPQVNAQIASVRNDSREVSPIRQPEQDLARRILSRPAAREETSVWATYIPRQIPVLPSQVPHRSPGISSRRSIAGGSATGNTQVQSHQYSQESRVPRTVLTPRPEEPTEGTQNTVEDPSDSDSDSTSSVYTAFEGDMDTDAIPKMGHRSGPNEMTASMPS